MPLLIKSPYPNDRHNEVTYSMTTLLDIVPTLLDWYNIKYPLDNDISQASPLTGRSLLGLLKKGNIDFKNAFLS